MAGELAKLNVKIGVDDSDAKSGMDRVTSSTKAQTKSITETLGSIGKSLNDNLNTTATTNFSGGLDRLGSKFGVARSAINGHVSGGFGLTDASAIGMNSISSISNGMTSMGKTVETSTSKSSGFLSGLGSAFKNMRDSADKSSANGFGFGLHVGAGIQAITALTGSIGSIITQTVSASDALFKFKQTMQFAGLDNKAIKQATTDAKEYADQTVYGLDDITSTTAQLASNGIKNYTELTQASGNLNAVAGGNANTFKSVSLVLTQTAGAGKLTTENWNQLADAIPGASGKLQEAMRNNGAYTGNFRDAMEAGQISADEFNQALIQLGNTDVAKKAATSTETFEGAIGNLQANIVTKMNQVIENIGKDKLTDIINSIGDTVGNLISFFAGMVVFWKNNSKWLTPLIAGLTGAVVAINLITAALTVFNAITAISSALIAPITITVLAIAAAIAIIVAVIMNWGTITKWFGNVWQAIVDGISTGIKATGQVIGSVIDFIVNYWRTGWSIIAQVFSAIWNGIVAVFKFVLDGITAYIQFVISFWKTIFEFAFNAIATVIQVVWDVIKAIFVVAVTGIAVLIGTVFNIIKATIEGIMWAINTVISSVWNVIGGVVMGVINFIVSFITNAFNAIFNTISMAMSFIWNIIQAVWNTIAGIVGAVIGFIANIIVTGFNNFVNNVRIAMDFIWNIIQTVWNTIAGVVSAVVNTIASVISSVFNAIVGIVSSVFGTIASVASSVWNGIVNTISNVVNNIRNTISNVFSSIVGVVSGIFNGVKNAISGAMQGASDIVRNIINAIKGFFSFSIKWPHIPMPHFKINPSGWQIGDLLKGKIPSLGLDFYAKGGIMTAPTMFGMNGGNAMIGGEAGREAVLPLNRTTLGQIGEGILSATNTGQQEQSNQEINVTQNIYSHDTLTPREIERQARTEFEKYARDL